MFQLRTWGLGKRAVQRGDRLTHTIRGNLFTWPITLLYGLGSRSQHRLMLHEGKPDSATLWHVLCGLGDYGVTFWLTFNSRRAEVVPFATEGRETRKSKLCQKNVPPDPANWFQASIYFLAKEQLNHSRRRYCECRSATNIYRAIENSKK